MILHADDRSWGGVELGTDLDDAVAYVAVENLAIRSWFRHGIATPTTCTPMKTTIWSWAATPFRT